MGYFTSSLVSALPSTTTSPAIASYTFPTQKSCQNHSMNLLSSVTITPNAYGCSLLPYSTLAAPIYIKDKTVPSCLNLGNTTSSSSRGGSTMNNATIFVSQSVSSTILAAVWYTAAPTVFTNQFKNVVAAFVGIFPSAITVSTLLVCVDCPFGFTPSYYYCPPILYFLTLLYCSL